MEKNIIQIIDDIKTCQSKLTKLFDALDKMVKSEFINVKTIMINTGCSVRAYMGVKRNLPEIINKDRFDKIDLAEILTWKSIGEKTGKEILKCLKGGEEKI